MLTIEYQQKTCRTKVGQLVKVPVLRRWFVNAIEDFMQLCCAMNSRERGFATDQILSESNMDLWYNLHKFVGAALG